MNTKLFTKTTSVFTLMIFIFISSTTFATDGYFSLAYDTKSKGMAGAGVAMYQNSFFGNSNPASMVMHGKKMGFGLGLFNPNREYTITGDPSGFQGTFGLTPGTVKSDSKLFPLPSFVGNWMINDNSSFSVSLYGNGGMNTNYPTNTFYGSKGSTGVNLMQMFAGLTYSFKFADNWSAGISGIIAWQSFKAEGLEAFGQMSQDAANLSDNDGNSSFGFGGKVGIQGKVTKGFSVGATFQTKMYMGKFDEYKGLFAEQGDFDIPANWTIGMAYEILPDVLTFAFDIKQIYYSDVKSIANNMFTGQNFNAPLGSDNGAGFGWKDMTVYKFGLEFAANEDWTFRTGYSTGKNPIRKENVMFNILAPGVIDNHITFGFSKMMGEKELSIAIVHALSNTVKGTNPMEMPDQQEIELKMNQWEFEIAFTF